MCDQCNNEKSIISIEDTYEDGYTGIDRYENGDVYINGNELNLSCDVEVVAEKAKPGEWTPQEASHAAFPGIYIGLEPVFKEDRQKLFAWLHWHEVKIYEQD